MKAIIIGLGSIGKRHLRLLQEIDGMEIICLRSRGRIAGENVGSYKYVVSIEEALVEKPDFAIIATPTNFHIETALVLAEAGVPFLIEKPVSDTDQNLQKLLDLVNEKNLPTMVGFQLRHHPNFQKLQQLIKNGKIGKPLSLNGFVGHYLPDWRPDSNYRETSSARKELGGGVILDLCHQIDLAVALLGPAIKLSCFYGRFSNLEIGTEDLADITMLHKGGCQSHIHLDYLERRYNWTNRVVGEEGSAVWDYGEGFLEYYSSSGTSQIWQDPVDFERDTLFRSQLAEWLGVLKGNRTPSVSLEDGIQITNIVIQAKNSSKLGKHISL
jgi:predicted dehydrogenase